MNATVNFANLTWAAMAHAGWKSRFTGRNAREAAVNFTAPTGATEVRSVPLDRLTPALRAILDRAVPQRARAVPQLKTRFH